MSPHIGRALAPLVVLVLLASACRSSSVSVVPPAPDDEPTLLGFVDEPEPIRLTAASAVGRRAVEPAPFDAAEPQADCAFAEDATQVLDAARAEGTWAIGDLIDTVELHDGRTLWIFGDTFVGEVGPEGRVSDARMVHSSALVIQDGCVEPVATDDGWGWVSWPPDGTWLWPQGAVEGPHGLLYVFLVRVIHNPSARPGLDFTVVGGAIAAFHVEDLSQPLVVVDQPATVDGTRPFGWAPLVVDDHVLVTAHGPDGTHLARVPLSEVVRPQAWEFWTGSSWQHDRDASVPVHPDRLFLVHHATGGTIAQSIGFGAEELVRWEAPLPTGPYERQQVVPLPDVDTDVEWAYLPVALDDTTVAHNVMPWDPAVIPDDVATYGPRFVVLD